MNGLIGKLFTVIGNDADGKTIQYLLQLKILLPEERLDISFIKKYNRYVVLEKNLKKEGSPMIFTDADGKPLDAKTTPSVSYTPSFKIIPLPQDKPEKTEN